MKTTIELPEELFRRAKAQAALRGESLKDLITEALRHEVGKAAPVKERSTEEFWKELKAIARANSKAWKSKLGAVESIKEQRRG